jgi:integrin beta 3
MKWTVQAPHKHTRTPEKYPKGGLGDHNYCRNPDGVKDIWCYTTDPKKRWEYCDPIGEKKEEKPVFGPEECSQTKGMKGVCSGYRGKQNKTRSGKTCMKWTVQTPHKHSRTPEKFPNGGLGDHNYCRDPDGKSKTIWCYTTDSKKRWEYCDPIGDKKEPEYGPEECAGKRCRDYRGKQTKTKKGYTCQRWDVDKPHKRHYTPEKYPDAGLVENYCRNPSSKSSGKTIWCYTTDPKKRWDWCKPIGKPTPKTPTTKPTTKPSKG